jgi:RNA polymerase sigma-70 factor (ECF subfamily)
MVKNMSSTNLEKSADFRQECPLSSRTWNFPTFLRASERRAFKQAMFAVRNEETALDIVQDAMMRLAEKYGDRPANEWPMLFQRILQNAIRDFYRRSKGQITVDCPVTILAVSRRDDDDDRST